MTLYGMALIIPIVVLSVLFFYIFTHSLNSQTEEMLQSALNQAAENLNGKISRMNSVINLLSNNAHINTALNDEGISRYDVYSTINHEIIPVVTNISIMNPEVSRIHYITNNPLFINRPGIINNVNVNLGDWHERLQGNYGVKWFYDKITEGKLYKVAESNKLDLFAINRIFYNQDNGLRSYVAVELKSEVLFGGLDVLFQDGGILVRDASGTVVHSYIHGDRANEAMSTIGSGEVGRKDGYFVQHVNLEIPGWTIIGFVSNINIWEKMRPIVIVSFCVLFICFVATFLMLFRSTGYMIRRIENLGGVVALAADGNLQIYSSDDIPDEIGRLAQGYNHMLLSINDLIEKVYHTEIRFYESEIRALQAQINPHFLYNAFSLISSMAILSGETQISYTTNLISGYYRNMLSKGLVYITVEMELENLRSYIRIQQLLHNESFDVDFEIQQELLSCKIANMLLQPIVENAIIHGLGRLEDARRGRLRISADLEGNDMVFRVIDNGPGFSKDRFEEVLDEHSKSYGLSNVQSRVQFLFGKNYGLKRESRSEGATILLRVPADLEENMQNTK